MSFNSPSKGEKKIMEILKQNRISFQREVSFKDLNGLKNVPLRFDFAIFKDKKLIALIEIDGEQHFKFTHHHTPLRRYISVSTLPQKTISQDIAQ